MLFAGRAKGPTKKKKTPSFRKKKKLSRLIVSLLPRQELTSFLVKIFEELEKTVVTNDQAVQSAKFWPLMQTRLTPPTILMVAEINF